MDNYLLGVLGDSVCIFQTGFDKVDTNAHFAAISNSMPLFWLLSKTLRSGSIPMIYPTPLSR